MKLRWQTWALLAGANLFWAGNWIAGRALREIQTPLSLGFWRWALAALVLAPFAWFALRGRWPLVRRHLGLLALLGLTGCALFQTMVYAGLRGTTATNAVLLGSAAPLFVMLGAWVLDGQRATRDQLAGVWVSLAGIAVITSQGDLQKLVRMEFHAGDAWIIAALPVWGLYSALLRRLPSSLGGTAVLFPSAAFASLLLAVPLAFDRAGPPMPWHWDAAALAGIAYIVLFASVLAFFCWNRAVAEVGAGAASASLPLMPVFGTLLATTLLGESLQGFHVAGIAVILAGIALSARGSRARAPAKPAAAAAGTA